ncbi:MAG: glycosyltransferase [Chryseobacterium sp.]|nr:glycosyltransferase [Chryseobacterium sp.]
MGVWRNTKYFFRKINRIKKLDSSYRNEESKKIENFEVNFPIYHNPLVSIIIPFYNLENYTKLCLQSIADNLPNISFEIVLVNDNSTEKVNFDDIKNIKIINNEQNIGFLRSINKTIKQVKTPFIYLLNNDTLVKKGFLDELMYVFDNFEDVGAVGSMVLNEDGSLQEAGSFFLQNAKIMQTVDRKKAFYPEHNYIYEIDYCSGCSILFERQKKNGDLVLFDEKFVPAYFEETDLCFQLRYLDKKKIFYTPFSKIIHFNGVSYEQNEKLSERKQALFEKNFNLFKNKWDKELSNIKSQKLQERKNELNGTKEIVFYNGVVPEADKNSGELRLTEIIKAYNKNHYTATIIADRNKIDNPYNISFQKLGICVYYEHGIFFDKFLFLKRLKLKKPVSWFYSVKIFLKEYKPALLANKNTFLIFDMVDIHHLRLKGALQLNPKRFSLKRDYYKFLHQEKKASKRSHITIAVSEFEKRYMLKFVAENKLICISNVHFVKKHADEIPKFSNRTDLLFVGSVHPPNIDAIGFLISEIMPKIWEVDKSIKLHIVGNVAEKLSLQSHENIIVHGFVSDMDDYLLEAKIMLVPLRYGAGVKGKIGQAFEYSLPVITTSIGAEGMSLENMHNAIIADTASEFANAVLNLYNNENLWLKLQRNSEASLKPFSRENLDFQIKKIEERLGINK